AYSLELARGRRAWSEAEFDPGLVNYDAAHGVLTLPLNGFDGATGDYHAALGVYRADTEGGLSPVGQVDLDAPLRGSAGVGDDVYTVASSWGEGQPLANPPATRAAGAGAGPGLSGGGKAASVAPGRVWAGQG